MALKAGRRGLHKRLVDAFGNFNGEAPSGDYYTKQQTDNKFQKKTLEVPLEMLSGSKLTVEGALQGLNEEKFTYADNGVLGAKNLLPFPYKEGTKTLEGVTFTVNTDGSVTANGTATANSTFVLQYRTTPSAIKLEVGRTYRLTGGKSNQLSIGVSTEKNGSAYYYGYDTGNGLEFTPQTGDVSFGALIQVTKGSTVNNVTVYPMLRLASDPDDTYVPYAMTNRDITEKLKSVRTGDVSGIALYKYGNIVTVNFDGMVAVTKDADEAFFTLPVGYRPPEIIQFIEPLNNRRIVISNNGNISSKSALENTYIRGYITFIVM